MITRLRPSSLLRNAVRSRCDLLLENLALRQQLAILFANHGGQGLSLPAGSPGQVYLGSGQTGDLPVSWYGRCMSSAFFGLFGPVSNGHFDRALAHG